MAHTASPACLSSLFASQSSSLKAKVEFSKAATHSSKAGQVRLVPMATATEAKEVKLWGGRFQEAVTPAVEKFGQSVSYDQKLYKFDIQGSKAHATMLAAQVRPWR